VIRPDCDICGADNATIAISTRTLCVGCADAEAEKPPAPPPENPKPLSLTIFDPLTGETVVLWVSP
jgi:hypothetical protein